jgi:hypothetical protein
MNPQHAETKKSLAMLNDKKPLLADQELDDLYRALQHTRQLTATILSTKMRCCGLLLPDFTISAGNGLRPAFCEKGYHGEVWVLDSATSSATPRWLVLGTADSLTPASLRNCYLGQILFAPDNPLLDTAEARERLLEQFPDALRQPQAWPIAR